MSRQLDGAPANWRECTSDGERMRWLYRQLFWAHRSSLRLSERAQNSPDRVTVRAAVREVEAAGGLALYSGGPVPQPPRSPVCAFCHVAPVDLAGDVCGACGGGT